jgi:tetratricopeptide (TPR) repeat protein
VDRHLSSYELADLAVGELPCLARRRELVRHILAGCPSCLAGLQQLGKQTPLPGFLRKPLSGARRAISTHFDYEPAFSAAERSLSFFLAEGRPVLEPPGALLAELGRAVGDFERASPVASPESSTLPFLTRWLIEKSHSCRYADLEEMLQWALMARIAAQTCSAGIAGSAPKRADLCARAEAQLANALRVLGRSEEADATMKRVWEQLGKGTGDRLLQASVLQKSNSLLTLQGHFTLALDHIREATGIFDELGLRHQRAVAQLNEAITWFHCGEPDRATRLLEDALPWIDPSEDAYLPLVARHNLILSLIKLGETSRALALYLETRIATFDRQQTSIMLKLQWHEGKLLLALGMADAAEQTLARVRSGFLRRKLGHELVLVTSDLVRVHLETGKSGAIEREVAETTARVQAWNSGPEVIRSLAELRSLGLSG